MKFYFLYRSKFITVYSNTDKVFIFKLLPKINQSTLLKENFEVSNEIYQNFDMEYDLILLNPHCFSTDNYILDCDILGDISDKNKISIRLFTRNFKYDFIELFVLNELDKVNSMNAEVKKSKVLEAPFVQTKSSIRHCDENKFEKYFYKFINLKESKFSNQLNQANYCFYSINEENVCLYKSEEEIILHSLLPDKVGNSKELVLMENYSNLYCSHLFVDDYLLVNYEKEFVIIKEKIVLAKLANENFYSRNIILLKDCSNNKLIGFYDNQMNIIFVKINTDVLNKAYESYNTNDNNINLKPDDLMDIESENCIFNKNQVNFIEGVEFLKDKSILEILNQFDNGSNYCMDSVMLNDKDLNGFQSTKVFAVCGERGKSKIIQYEKALKEIRLTNFAYNQIRQIFLAENKNKDVRILFVNTFSETTSFYLGFENGQINFYDLNLKDYPLINGSEEIEKTLDAFFLNDDKTIIHFTNQRINAFSLILDNKTNIKKLELIETTMLKANKNIDKNLNIFKNFQEFLMKISIEDSDATIISMKHLSSFYHNDSIFIVLLMSNFKISVFRSDIYNSIISIVEENTIDYFTTVSSFDITISKNYLSIITGTYDSKLEIINYDCTEKDLIKKNECLLEAENSNIVPESIKISEDNKLVYVSTRIGKFAIFSFDELNSNLHFLGSFNPKSDEIEPLIISDCQIKENDNYTLTLFSNNNSYLLELNFSNDMKNMNSKLSKYLVETKSNEESIRENIISHENYGLKNCINFFLNINLFNLEINENKTQISIYQNNNLICVSHFQKVNENSLLINNVKLYEKNVLAKRIIALNNTNLCILYNENTEQSINWKLNIININNLNEKTIEIETQNELKINVMKTFEIEFNNMEYSDEENRIKYLTLGGEFTQTESNNTQIIKGVFYIYKISMTKNNYCNLEYIKKYCIADPIYDLCQINNNIFLTCNNNIYSTSIEIDDLNRKIEIVPKNKQPHMNKLVSCESVNNSNYILVGDVSESFNLMEFDPKSCRFEVAAAELSLKTLFKGKIKIITYNYLKSYLKIIILNYKSYS